MLTPYQRAQAVYMAEPCARTFAEDLDWHLRLGWVVSRPDLFLMARQVDSCWELRRLVSPWYVSPLGNAVWIWLLAGDMRAALNAIPWPASVDWVGWERGNVPRWHQREKLVAKLNPSLPDFGCWTVTDHISSLGLSTPGGA